jgi:hypothetical protein
MYYSGIQEERERTKGKTMTRQERRITEATNMLSKHFGIDAAEIEVIRITGNKLTHLEWFSGNGRQSWEVGMVLWHAKNVW